LRTDRGEWGNQLERFKGYLNDWIKGLAGKKSDLPSDSEQLRLRKAVLILKAEDDMTLVVVKVADENALF
jgi:hypothetical protein